MVNLKCPSCGSYNLQQIDINYCRCAQCGNTVSIQQIAPPPQPQPVQQPQSMPAQQPQQTSAYSNQPNTPYNQPNRYNPQPQPTQPDIPNRGLGFLSFLTIVLGFVLSGIYSKTRPNSAKVYKKCAIAGIIVCAASIASYYTFYFFYFFALMSAL